MKLQRYLLVFILFSLSLCSGLTPVIAQGKSVAEEQVSTFSSQITRMSYASDNNGSRYFLYLEGDDVIAEPQGSAYEASHILKFSTFEIDNPASLITENITDQLVYPYHYSIVLDSNKRVHTAFVTDGYTLHYGYKDVGQPWNITQILDPTVWFAIAPAITLGENEEPRLIYKTIWGDNNFDVFGTFASPGFIGMVYSAKNGTDWLHWDVADNHQGIFDFPGPRNLDQFSPFNPSIYYDEGRIMISYNNKISSSVASRLYYQNIPEFPEVDFNFSKFEHTRAWEASVFETTFTKPKFILFDNSVILLAGTFRSGGAAIALLDNKTAIPRLVNNFQDPVQWESGEIDLGIHSQETRSIDAVMDSGGNLHVVYSAYRLFNELESIYKEDIDMVIYNPTVNGLGDKEIISITESQRVQHDYPHIVLSEEGVIEIVSIVHPEDEPATFNVFEVTDLPEFTSEAVSGVIFVVLLATLVLVGWYFFLKKFIVIEEEEEILPHMVNLKEVITEH